MKRIAALILAMSVLAGLPMLTPLHSSTQRGITVAVTLPYLSHIVRVIGGDRVTVISLIPPTANPHSYEPPMKELVSELSNVSLILMTGPSHLIIEKRIRDLKDSGVIKADIVDYRTYEEYGLKLLRNPRTGLVNPHGYVFSLKGLKAIAMAVAAELSRLDPSGSEYYKARLESYIKVLNDEQVTCRVGKELNVIIISPILQYAVSDLGLNITYVLLPSVEVEPTQKDIASLRRLLASNRNNVVVGSDVIISKSPKILQLLKGLGIKPVIVPITKFTQAPELIPPALAALLLEEGGGTIPTARPARNVGVSTSLLIGGLIVEAGVIGVLFILLFRWRRAVIETLCKTAFEVGEKNA